MGGSTHSELRHLDKDWTVPTEADRFSDQPLIDVTVKQKE